MCYASSASHVCLAQDLAVLSPTCLCLPPLLAPYRHACRYQNRDVLACVMKTSRLIQHSPSPFRFVGFPLSNAFTGDVRGCYRRNGRLSGRELLALHGDHVQPARPAHDPPGREDVQRESPFEFGTGVSSVKILFSSSPVGFMTHLHD